MRSTLICFIDTKTKVLLMAVLLIFLTACSASKQSVKDNAQTYKTDFEYEKDRVLVLLVDLQPNGASMRNSKLINGNFKPATEPILQQETVRVQYLDEQGQVLYEKILEHPLVQYKEYVDEDGALKYVRVEERTGTLLLRSQYSRNFKSLRIDYGIGNEFRKVSQMAIVVDD